MLRPTVAWCCPLTTRPASCAGAAVILDGLKIYQQPLGNSKKIFSGGTILITGSAGFIGFYLTNFFRRFREDLNIKKKIWN